MLPLWRKPAIATPHATMTAPKYGMVLKTSAAQRSAKTAASPRSAGAKRSGGCRRGTARPTGISTRPRAGIGSCMQASRAVLAALTAHPAITRFGREAPPKPFFAVTDTRAQERRVSPATSGARKPLPYSVREEHNDDAKDGRDGFRSSGFRRRRLDDCGAERGRGFATGGGRPRRAQRAM